MVQNYKYSVDFDLDFSFTVNNLRVLVPSIAELEPARSRIILVNPEP
jgi:hypothetical protein